MSPSKLSVYNSARCGLATRCRLAGGWLLVGLVGLASGCGRGERSVAAEPEVPARAASVVAEVTAEVAAEMPTKPAEEKVEPVAVMTEPAFEWGEPIAWADEPAFRVDLRWTGLDQPEPTWGQPARSDPAAEADAEKKRLQDTGDWREPSGVFIRPDLDPRGLQYKVDPSFGFEEQGRLLQGMMIRAQISF